MRALIVSAAIAPLVVVGLAPAPAHAFHNETDFAAPGTSGGGGGMFFTGSPRSRGWDCSICHIDEERAIAFTVASDPPGLFESGVYAPGQTYALTVQIQGEHRGLEAPLNRNTFVAEFLDDDAVPAGTLGNPNEWMDLQGEGSAITARGRKFSTEIEWRFEWLAPLPGEAGPVTVYLAGVDGNGNGPGTDGDPFGDDVFSGSVELLPEGAVRGQEVIDSSCSAGGSPGSSLPLSVALPFLVLLLWRRRQRLAVPLVAIGLTLGLAAGCGGDDEAPVVDCRSTICAPDSGGGADATAGFDASGTDAGGTDAGDPVGRDGSAATDGGGPIDTCRGTDVIVEEVGRFCQRSCYCRDPEMCLPIEAGEDCCRDSVICPHGDQTFAGCRPRAANLSGDRVTCEHGFCFCATDDSCYAGPAAAADACCAAPVRCF